MSACEVYGAEMRNGTIEFTLKTAAGPMVVQHVPARICPRCGADALTLETVQRLELLKNEVENAGRQPDGVIARPWMDYATPEQTIPPSMGRLHELEALAPTTLVPRLKEHFTLTLEAFNLISHLLTAVPRTPISSMPASLPVATKLLLRLSNDLRGIDLCAMHGYPAQACAICASAYEVAYAVGYIGDDEERARVWLDHRDPKWYPWKMRTMMLDALAKMGVSDPDAQTVNEYRVYRQLCLAKHANPLFEGLYGVQVHEQTLVMANGPDTSEDAIRPTRFALQHGASAAVIATASFHKHHLLRYPDSPQLDRLLAKINSLWGRCRELDAAARTQYGNEDPFPGRW